MGGTGAARSHHKVRRRRPLVNDPRHPPGARTSRQAGAQAATQST
jgi:hypothetical protein